MNVIDYGVDLQLYTDYCMGVLVVEADYVTVLPTLDPYRFLVCVMRYHPRDDEFVQTKCSSALKEPAARALAESWAAAARLEIR